MLAATQGWQVGSSSHCLVLSLFLLPTSCWPDYIVLLAPVCSSLHYIIHILETYRAKGSYSTLNHPHHPSWSLGSPATGQMSIAYVL